MHGKIVFLTIIIFTGKYDAILNSLSASRYFFPFFPHAFARRDSLPKFLCGPKVTTGYDFGCHPRRREKPWERGCLGLWFSRACVNISLIR